MDRLLYLTWDRIYLNLGEVSKECLINLVIGEGLNLPDSVIVKALLEDSSDDDGDVIIVLNPKEMVRTNTKITSSKLIVYEGDCSINSFKEFESRFHIIGGTFKDVSYLFLNGGSLSHSWSNTWIECIPTHERLDNSMWDEENLKHFVLTLQRTMNPTILPQSLNHLISWLNWGIIDDLEGKYRNIINDALFKSTYFEQINGEANF